MSDTLYDVVEIFDSINGEGLNAGKLATFVRLKGCNLRCSYCDTAWAITPDAPSVKMSAEEIKSSILASGLEHVTLTGGEPLLVDKSVELLTALVSDRYKIDIETNGSVPIRPILEHEGLSAVDLIMDYKLPSSGMTESMHLENLELIRKQDTVKFVIGSEADMDEAYSIIKKYSLTGRTNIYFSPVFGSITPEAMVDFMKKHRLNGVTLQLQLHKIIWHPDAKGV
ncbi:MULTISPECIES: putative 7-carboxy-7-deazaguanine synthase QueE [unclassified Fusibacter]|uniref:putative 7-carboxy-7-deazaguanine synthase QueE n=1 Tax=unclassified Fusibacter TaxID=2624464 RepID=UPI001013A7E9|nr:MULTISPECIES: putative 7-carboxy-7-deazaguanine synthase QueE [unclassified Fusibacter]MCK8059781.1 putative 7-carboxy-7-deazaguanine synthase QueE [Fusibacter sp. A2]NPE21582.1 putative 7-carboxy-7-deazaguanine synthase QueE [Fusibacter sp. A1]RXV61990.1 putative 7-carboxy-7-deazaguanine synthase QueE [Fusibacter sp. A1]